MKTQTQPIAKATMLIRRPPRDVFEALVNPEITSKFWFTESTGRLEKDKTVTWTWGQFGVSAEITVTDLEQNKHIKFNWPADEAGDIMRTVEITLEPKSDETTFLHVVEKGFDEDDKKLIEYIVGQTQGWALVLSALKAYLEHDIILKVVDDHVPK